MGLSRASSSETAVTSPAIRFTIRDRLCPGPTSMKVSTPSRVIRRTFSAHSTGDFNWASNSARTSAAVRSSSAEMLDTIGRSGSANGISLITCANSAACPTCSGV